MANKNKKDNGVKLSVAKTKLRLCNLIIAVLCVVAMFFLYSQPFWTVKISYAVTAEQLQAMLAENMQVELSEESLRDVELKVDLSLTLDGSTLTGLFADEVRTLIEQNGSSEKNDSSDGQSNDTLTAFIETCRENEKIGETIQTTVDGLLVQLEAMIPQVVAVYVQAVVEGQIQEAGGNLNGSGEQPASAANGEAEASLIQNFSQVRVTNTDVASAEDIASEITSGNNDLAALIEELLKKENITTEEATETVMGYLESNKEDLGLNDEDMAAVESEVSSFVESIADENGSINVEKAVTDILVETGMIDQSKVEDGAELSDLLTEFIIGLMGEASDVLYIVFMVFSLILGVLYLLWGLLLIKSVIKILTGRPMGAFFVKAFSALPYVVLVLLPTLALSYGGMDAVIGAVVSTAPELAQYLSGLSIAVGGSYLAPVCTLLLFLFGFVYSIFKKEYKKLK